MSVPLRVEEQKYAYVRKAYALQKRKEEAAQREAMMRSTQRSQALRDEEERKRAMERQWYQTRRRNQSTWQKVLEEEDARKEAEHNALVQALEERTYRESNDVELVQAVHQEKAKINHLRMKRRVLALEREESKFISKLDAALTAQEKLQKAEKMRKRRIAEKAERVKADLSFRAENNQQNLRRVERAHERKVELLQTNIARYMAKTKADEKLRRVIRQQAIELSSSLQETEAMMKTMFREAEARRYRDIVEVATATGSRPLSASGGRNNNTSGGGGGGGGGRSGRVGSTSADHEDAIRDILAGDSNGFQSQFDRDGGLSLDTVRKIEAMASGSAHRGRESSYDHGMSPSPSHHGRSSTAGPSNNSGYYGGGGGGGGGGGHAGVSAETMAKIEAMARGNSYDGGRSGSGGVSGSGPLEGIDMRTFRRSNLGSGSGRERRRSDELSSLPSEIF